MTSELMSLTWVTTLTALLWIPYILNMIAVRGLTQAVGYPDDPEPLAPWAAKMKAGHANAVENLVVFGLLVLIAHVVDANNNLTGPAAMVYFFSRLAHYLVYMAGIPVLRTLIFAVGWATQIVFVLAILRIA